MCGLVASLVHSPGELYDALHLMRHRGTEAPVLSRCGHVGHVRLPIVGLGDEGAQPVELDGDQVLAFVGEILDFREGYPGLESDVQLVEYMWSRNSYHDFKNHDGFWSVVVYDRASDELTLFCDYLGQKPLYYREDYPSCASEPDACASLGRVTPDRLYLDAVVRWGYCPDPVRTPYAEVKRVLPGELVILGRHGSGYHEVVDPLAPRPLSLEGLKLEVEEAVRRRALSSDVPVACLLSGGLDSSVVYTIASRYADVVPYLAVEGLGLEDDRRWARAVAGDKVVEVGWADVGDDVALRWMQEPLDLGSLVPQCALSLAVGDRQRVCLTGDGADEFFGGYGRAQRYDSQSGDVFGEIVSWHLPRLDRVMMRNRVEVRSPFLARRVAAAALALPRAERTAKKVLKDLFRADLPPGLADRPKVPLRTVDVAADREARSRALVRSFMQGRGWEPIC